MQPLPHFNSYIQKSIVENWDRLALSDLNGIAMQYSSAARKIAKLHIFFEHSGVKHGDRIALVGRNSSQWSVAFMAILSYGAVAVPILHDFHTDNIQHLVTHSEAKVIFCDSSIWVNLDQEKMPIYVAALRIADFSLLDARTEKARYARQRLHFHQ